MRISVRVGVVVGGLAVATAGIFACVGDSGSSPIVVEDSGAPDSSTTGTDGTAASTDAGSGVDAFVPCPQQLWNKPAALSAGIDTLQNELSATLMPDGLTMFFTRASGGGVSVYESVKEAGALFTTGAQVNDIATSFNGGMTGQITSDGLTIYFHYRAVPDGGVDSDASSTAAFDIYTYTRLTLNDPFVGPTPVLGINTPANELQPFISADGNTLYFSSDRESDAGANEAGTTVNKIYQATKSGGGFLTPVALDSILPVGATGSAAFPVVNAAQTTLYFSASAATGGSNDIYMATRASAGSNFGVGQPVVELNSSSDDRPAWISPDECVLYIVSNSPKNYDIFIAKR